ncbi:MAG: glycogen/starch synthase [Lewinellaceae bacterium]|nr:glycogen/starch synthase [Lewinella sp.]MCB9280788.1 glycogen/starch synthase [Lewinellaceae bacterium]
MKKEKILVHLTSEVAPFYKRGGLADVVGSLPYNLGAEYDNIVISFFYQHRMNHLEDVPRQEFFMEIHGVDYRCYYYKVIKGEVTFYFLNLEDENIFSDSEAGNSNKPVNGDAPYVAAIPIMAYFYFAKAFLTMIRMLDISFEFLILHDWHVCGIFGFPEQLDQLKKKQSFLSMLLIHNFEFQGDILPDVFSCMDPETKERVDAVNRKFGSVTLLSLGLEYADIVSTVSENYARELGEKHLPHSGFKFLEGKEKKIKSLPNGVDRGLWHPATSPHLVLNYDENTAHAKDFYKKQLCLDAGFASDQAPVLLFMARLTHQKGISFLLDFREQAEKAFCDLENVLRTGVNLVVFGNPGGGLSGRIHKYFLQAGEEFKGRFYYDWKYSDEKAHQMLAGADMLLAPSLFEPCGLVQLYAMSFGAVPLVRPTGGLKDTVIDFYAQPDQATGFHIPGYTREGLVSAIQTAADLYSHQREAWDQLRIRGMLTDWSWNRMNSAYDRLFRMVRSNTLYI